METAKIFYYIGARLLPLVAFFLSLDIHNGTIRFCINHTKQQNVRYFYWSYTNSHNLHYETSYSPSTIRLTSHKTKAIEPFQLLFECNTDLLLNIYIVTVDNITPTWHLVWIEQVWHSDKVYRLRIYQHTSTSLLFYCLATSMRILDKSAKIGWDPSIARCKAKLFLRSALSNIVHSRSFNWITSLFISAQKNSNQTHFSTTRLWSSYERRVHMY